MVFSLLGAPRCVGCRSAGGPLCPSCAEDLRPAVATGPGAPILAGCAYEGAARSLVLGLKLQGVRSFAEPLAALCVRQLHRAGTTAEAVTWVPGRRADIKRRGFDHAAEIARAVADRTGLPRASLLRRAGPARDQTELGRAERLTNLTGAFTATPNHFQVLLVDDLCTTGATAAVCSTALAEAGARSVEVVVACRA
jgi:predicted amidophosphoribosyltransferase